MSLARNVVESGSVGPVGLCAVDPWLRQFERGGVGEREREDANVKKRDKA